MNTPSEEPTLHELLSRVAELEQAHTRLHEELTHVRAERAPAAEEQASAQTRTRLRGSSRRKVLEKGLGVAVATVGAATLLELSSGTAAASAPIKPGDFASSTAGTPAVRATGTNGADGVDAFSNTASAPAVKASGTNGAHGVDASSDSGTGVSATSSSGTGIFAQSGSFNAIHAVGGGGGTSALFAEGGTGFGVFATSDNPSGSGDGVRGSSHGSGNGVTGISALPGGIGNGVEGIGHTGDGVVGTSDSGNGVHGQSTSGNGVSGTSTSGTGIFAQSGSSNAIHAKGGGTGVSALFAEGGTGFGVFATSSITGGSGDGVRSITGGSGNGVTGISNVTGSGNGVTGISQGSGNGITGTGGSIGSTGGTGVLGTGGIGNIGGTGGTGVLGTGGSQLSSVSGTGGIGVHGVGGLSGSGVPRGLAGLFDGNVQVNGNLSINGTLSKSSGSFKIDHPLDPAHKYLYHSFVESPDMKNIYDGVVTLDANGEAEVRLPAWFDALNTEFRYQLTAIGASAPELYIAEEINVSRFKIAGGKAGMRVSWQVSGIRQDAWANAYRIPVEEDKPESEQGSYLHPELYGQPEQPSVVRLRSPESPLLTRPR